MIPRKMREELGNKVYIMQGFDGALSVYTEARYVLLSEEFARLPFNNKKNRDYLRAQFMTTYDMDVDKLGRVQIPTALLKKFGISRNVTVLGMGDQIEIWDSAKYEAYEQEAIENFDKNAEEI